MPGSLTTWVDSQSPKCRVCHCFQLAFSSFTCHVCPGRHAFGPAAAAAAAPSYEHMSKPGPPQGFQSFSSSVCSPATAISASTRSQNNHRHCYPRDSSLPALALRVSKHERAGGSIAADDLLLLCDQRHQRQHNSTPTRPSQTANSQQVGPLKSSPRYEAAAPHALQSTVVLDPPARPMLPLRTWRSPRRRRLGARP
jgi:hypothetical protein